MSVEQEEMLLNGALDRMTTAAQHDAISAKLFAVLPEVDDDIIMVTPGNAPDDAATGSSPKSLYKSPTGKSYKKKVFLMGK